MTLVELIISMLIIAVAATGAISLMNWSSRNSADPVRSKQALLIAEAIMEEVQSADFTFCDPADPNAAIAVGTAACAAATVEQLGPEAGNVRPFDNVNDYATGLANIGPRTLTNANGQYVDANGANATPTGYNATVAVQPNVSLGPPGAVINSTAQPATMNAILITVQVRYGTSPNDVIRLDGYRTRYAPQ